MSLDPQNFLLTFLFPFSHSPKEMVFFERKHEERYTGPSTLKNVSSLIFSDISERNNDYSDTLDFRRGRVGDVRVVTFFVLKVPDYESAMLIYRVFI